MGTQGNNFRSIIFATASGFLLIALFAFFIMPISAEKESTVPAPDSIPGQTTEEATRSIKPPLIDLEAIPKRVGVPYIVLSGWIDPNSTKPTTLLFTGGHEPLRINYFPESKQGHDFSAVYRLGQNRTNHLEIRAIDKSENMSDPVSLEVVHDNTPPTDEIISVDVHSPDAKGMVMVIGTISPGDRTAVKVRARDIIKCMKDQKKEDEQEPCPAEIIGGIDTTNWSFRLRFPPDAGVEEDDPISIALEDDVGNTTMPYLARTGAIRKRGDATPPFPVKNVWLGTFWGWRERSHREGALTALNCNYGCQSTNNEHLASRSEPTDASFIMVEYKKEFSIMGFKFSSFLSGTGSFVHIFNPRPYEPGAVLSLYASCGAWPWSIDDGPNYGEYIGYEALVPLREGKITFPIEGKGLDSGVMVGLMVYHLEPFENIVGWMVHGYRPMVCNGGPFFIQPYHAFTYNFWPQPFGGSAKPDKNGLAIVGYDVDTYAGKDVIKPINSGRWEIHWLAYNMVVGLCGYPGSDEGPPECQANPTPRYLLKKEEKLLRAYVMTPGGQPPPPGGTFIWELKNNKNKDGKKIAEWKNGPCKKSTCTIRALNPGTVTVVVKYRSSKLPVDVPCQKPKKITVLNIDLDVDGDGKLSDENGIDGVANYLPGYESSDPKIEDSRTQNMKVIVKGVSEGTKVEFKLVEEHTSAYEGYCGNVRSDEFKNSNSDKDYVLNSSSEKEIGAAWDDNDCEENETVTKVAGKDEKAWCWIRCRDYGGETEVAVTIDEKNDEKNGEENGEENEYHHLLQIPKNKDRSEIDHLPDLWEDRFHETIPGLIDSSDDDVDLFGSHKVKGDGFIAFEEYRGFRILDRLNPGNQRIHRRMDEMRNEATHPLEAKATLTGPLVKDAFVAETSTDTGGGEKLFSLYGGKASTVFGISWHLVHPEDKGTDPKYYNEDSGQINRCTAFNNHKQYALLLISTQTPPPNIGGALGLGGTTPVFNNPDPIQLFMENIRDTLRYFKLENDPTAFRKAKAAVLLHEIGHRLTLRHLVDVYELTPADVLPRDTNLEALGKKAILVDGENMIKIRLKIQRRKDMVKDGQGYGHSTENVAYVDYDKIKMGTVLFEQSDNTTGILWEADYHSHDPYQEKYKLLSEIPPEDISNSTPMSDYVEKADILFRFKNDATSFIQDLKSGKYTRARIAIWRGYTCLMDSRLTAQDPQFSLTSETTNKPTVDLYPKCQLKGKRPPEKGEKCYLNKNDKRK